MRGTDFHVVPHFFLNNILNQIAWNAESHWFFDYR